MKTAVIISGHMRTFAVCLPTFRWQVLRHFGDEIDFYVSTVEDANAPTWKLLEKAFPHRPVYCEVLPSQPTIPVPPEWGDETKWQANVCHTWEPYAISVSPQAVLRQLWQLNEAWKLYRRSGPTDHTIIIRARPDLWFSGFQMPDSLVAHPTAIIDSQKAFTPWWGRFGGINDRFAMLGAEAASNYFRTFTRLPELIAAGAPMHPETLIRASMELAGCIVDDTLRVEFSTVRNNGEARAPEIGPIDIAHAALSRR